MPYPNFMQKYGFFLALATGFWDIHDKKIILKVKSKNENNSKKRFIFVGKLIVIIVIYEKNSIDSRSFISLIAKS